MKPPRVAFSLIPILFLGACRPALTDANAPIESARVFCKKHRACETDRWTDSFQEDMEACRDELTDEFDDLRDGLALLGLDLDLEELELCLSDVRELECYDFEDGELGGNCADVFGW